MDEIFLLDEYDDESSKAHTEDTHKPAKRRKDRTDDVSTLLKAIENVSDDKEMTANQSFFTSMAARTEHFDSRTKSTLHLQILQLIHDTEFDAI